MVLALLRKKERLSGEIMGSNNVIKFPGGAAEKSKSQPTSKARPPKTPSGADPKNTLKAAVQSKPFISAVILGLMTFSFNFMFSANESGIFSSIGSSARGPNARGVASVGPLSNMTAQHQMDLGKMLASTEPLGSFQAVGRSPSSDDRVRHGVLASRGYVFKRSIESGNLVSIRLQADESNPAYLLNPQDFLREYGEWLNSDFQNVELSEVGEETTGDRRISHYILTTHSGKKYEVKVERDLFQRLTSLDQTEVAGHEFH